MGIENYIHLLFIGFTHQLKSSMMNKEKDL